MSEHAGAKHWSARSEMVFPGTLMLVIGGFQILQGIVAIMDRAFFAPGTNYTYTVNLTTWGWLHIGLGIALVVGGIAAYTGMTWARAFGVGLVVLSLVDNFFFIPFYPIWSVLIIALNVAALWGLAMAGRRLPATAEGREAGAMGMGMGGGRGAAHREGQRWAATNPAYSGETGGQMPSDVKPPSAPQAPQAPSMPSMGQRSDQGR